MKNKTKITLSILLATSLFAFNGCKKDKTKTELLTDGSWKLTGFSISPAVDVNGDGTDDSDLFSLFFEDCDKDDFTTFSSAGTLTNDAGATKCDPAESQTTTGTWSFKENESKIDITSDGNTMPVATIGTLDETTFKISYPDSIGGGLSTYTLTWGKK